MRRRHLDDNRGPGLLHSQEPSESLVELKVRGRGERKRKRLIRKEGGVILSGRLPGLSGVDDASFRQSLLPAKVA